MIIRKKYKFEAAHIVRNCASTRCSKNIHGHSYIVEIKIGSNLLDDGGMVLDFGLLKATIGEFVDWFDHSLIVWIEDAEMMNVAKENNQRISFIPFNATAENIAKVFFIAMLNILENTSFKNGETPIISSVIVHETATGYAECFYSDINLYDRKSIQLIHFEHVDSENTLLKIIAGTWDGQWDNPETL